jgi:mono/diheme cytochrome c family protein
MPHTKLIPLTLVLIHCSLPVGAAPDFDRDIRPLLQERCVECHGEKKNKADLRLDAKVHALTGGESGPAFVPGDAANSLIYQRVTTADPDLIMPPKGEPLSSTQKQLLQAWINAGAQWPESAVDQAAKVDKRLEHWAFRPLRPTPTLPASSIHPIDHFMTAKLAESQLTLSPTADPRTLLRRLHLTVTGLLPNPQQIAEFDDSPTSYLATVDQLLSSPQFGERWARHWLDIVRFAESDGFEKNNARENAWPYRDYVIEAFNRDTPYDQFILEQLAGDALNQDAATGFLVGGPVDRVKSRDPVLTANQRADELHDMVGTTAATFLGLTVNCARCHNHKFDPISAEDYYAMTAMLQGVQHGERPLRNQATLAKEQQIAALQQRLRPIEEQLRAYQPLAGLNRQTLIDDDAAAATPNRAGVTQIKPPQNAKPITYSPGRDKGQADDPGNGLRLPQLGTSYRYWSAAAGVSEDLFSWNPHLKGRHRIWVSWGSWTTHTRDAHYLIDHDGDLTTTTDQTLLATVDQSQFADGNPAIPDQRRWSGFRPIGEHELTPTSVLLLRSGSKGGPHVADVVAFEQVATDQSRSTPPTQPALRAPVSHLANEDRFKPHTAKYLRFVITASSSGEPCLDEVEIYTANSNSPNLAAAKLGTRVTVSGTYAAGANAKHQPNHLNDGRYGNDFSWISDQKKGGWVQFELPQVQPIARVVWSRDRQSGKANRMIHQDRLPIGYRIEASMDGQTWQALASSNDRLPPSYRDRIRDVPTLQDVPAEAADQIAKLAAERNALINEIGELEKPQLVYAGTFTQPGPTHRLHRGDPMAPREAVAPGALASIGPHPLRLDPNTPEQERRLALARWIADPEHPLTARVIVNRIWHYYFGTGLVDTPSDFGLNGSRPSHPELLDFLAQQLITNGWRLKPIHRLILTSQTFRQSSAFRAEAAAIDSNARLLWRFPPRRIEAEALRDAMLTVSGKLDPSSGGPGFDLFEPNTNYVKVYLTKNEFSSGDFRRMVYQSKPRTMLDDFFGAFDCPDAGQPAPARTSSTTPLQALNLLNSPFALQIAGDMAARLQAEAGADSAKQIEQAFRLLFQRRPNDTERAAATSLVQQHGLTTLCRALLNTNEFLHLN